MQKKETFGEYIRKLREESGLPIRKIAAELDIDPSTLSKIERNARSANKDLIKNIAKIFKVSEKELLLYYYSDKIVYELRDEDIGIEALKVAEQRIKYIIKTRK
ncbi:MAG: helix-turn-helix transcriptional regulator [Cytophagales bacterium]|nr:helix-turn-helix transcriptional regulator [Cytophagales bacterium]